VGDGSNRPDIKCPEYTKKNNVNFARKNTGNVAHIAHNPVRVPTENPQRECERP